MPHKRAKRATREADKAKHGRDLPPPRPTADAHFHSLPKGAMRILNAAKIQADYHARRKAQMESGESGQPNNKRQKGKGKEAATAKKGGSSIDPRNMKIRPGEKLGDFNRRVEQAMAPEINSAMRSEAKANEKAKRKRREAEKVGPGEEEGDADGEAMERRPKPAEASSAELRRQREALEAGADVERDFAPAARGRRLHDIALAPPTLTSAPRGETQDAQRRKARLSAALSGLDPDLAEQAISGKRKVRLPDPIRRISSADGATGTATVVASLARKKVLEDERERVIKAYRARKGEEIKQVEERRAAKKSKTS